MPAQITACYDQNSRYFAAEVLRVLRAVPDIRNIYVNEYGCVFTNSTNTAVLLSEDGDIGLLVEAIQLDQGSPLSPSNFQPTLTSNQRQQWRTKTPARQAERPTRLRLKGKMINLFVYQVLIIHSAGSQKESRINLAATLENFGEMYASTTVVLARTDMKAASAANCSRRFSSTTALPT